MTCEYAGYHMRAQQMISCLHRMRLVKPISGEVLVQELSA